MQPITTSAGFRIVDVCLMAVPLPSYIMHRVRIKIKYATTSIHLKQVRMLDMHLRVRGAGHFIESNPMSCRRFMTSTVF